MTRQKPMTEKEREQFREALMSYLGNADLLYVSIEAAAKHFGQDGFSFRHQMRRAKINWTDAIREERRRRFGELCAKSDVRKTGDFYAEKLGYWDASAFYDFFKRWKGCRFSQWRTEELPPAKHAGHDLVDGVRAHLRKCDLLHETSETTATHFGMSPYELTRFLEWADTSWRNEVTRERQRRFERGVKYFGYEESIEFYQAECGYFERNSFLGFFERWKGLKFHQWQTDQIKREVLSSG